MNLKQTDVFIFIPTSEPYMVFEVHDGEVRMIDIFKTHERDITVPMSFLEAMVADGKLKLYTLAEYKEPTDEPRPGRKKKNKKRARV